MKWNPKTEINAVANPKLRNWNEHIVHLSISKMTCITKQNCNEAIKIRMIYFCDNISHDWMTTCYRSWKMFDWSASSSHCSLINVLRCLFIENARTKTGMKWNEQSFFFKGGGGRIFGVLRWYAFYIFCVYTLCSGRRRKKSSTTRIADLEKSQQVNKRERK